MNFKFIKQLNEDVNEADKIGIKDSWIISQQTVPDLPKPFYLVVDGDDGKHYRSKAGYNDKTKVEEYDDRIHAQGFIERRKFHEVNRHGTDIIED